MDKRKKRTSHHQYVIYLKMLKDDDNFRTGNVPRGADLNYLATKWDELAEKLNNCGNGPVLSADEWRKRLNDWKNSTRAKYRRTHSEQKLNDKSELALTPLEEEALSLWGPLSTKSLLSANFEPPSYIVDVDLLPDIKQSKKEIIIQDNPPLKENLDITEHTIRIENCPDSSLEEISPKRIRLENVEAAVTVIPTASATIPLANIEGIRMELQRIANVKEQKLQFEIAKFKFNNPGFQYEYNATNTQIDSPEQ